MSSLQQKEKLDVPGLTFRIEDLKPYLTAYAFRHIRVDPESGCWVYEIGRTKTGYVTLRYQNKAWRGHRLTYTLLVGPIPKGLELDHKCHDPSVCPFRDRRCMHRACVNPAHVEPKTHGENQRAGGKAHDLRAQTHCVHGHPYTPRNTKIARNGTRACNTCQAITIRKRHLKTHPNAKVKVDIGWWTADA